MPHVRFCAGGAQQWASLPQSPPLYATDMDFFWMLMDACILFKDVVTPPCQVK